MSCSFTNLVIAQLERWKEKAASKYEKKKKLYVLTKLLEEKVIALQLGKLGINPAKLTKDQVDYISMPIEGPYKPPHYRLCRRSSDQFRSLRAREETKKTTKREGEKKLFPLLVSHA